MRTPHPSALPVLPYTWTHESTQATTGYFSCVPPKDLGFDAALERLEAAPMDEFLHLHLLRQLPLQPQEALTRLAGSVQPPHVATERPVLAALLAENALLQAAPGATVADVLAREGISMATAHELASWTPTVHLRAFLLPDHALVATWNDLFRDNICGHHSLPHPDDADLEIPFSDEELQAVDSRLQAQHDQLARLHTAAVEHAGAVVPRPPAQETYLRAMDALMENGVLDGPELRHEASLSPIALLRGWRLDVAVDNSPLRYTLRGKGTAYGRGLSLAATRASCAMEIVERASAYAAITSNVGSDHQVGHIGDRQQPLPLYKARRSDLLACGRAALDPNRLLPEAPYRDEALHWIPARDATGAAVLVPAQAVLLFCNLDEPSLFVSVGSTGLASGNTMDEAVVSALTELVERDAEATTPFVRSQCFTLRSRDTRLQSLLDDYAACGIRVQFQDVTTELGLPAYQCFVQGQDGSLARATAASLCGQRAALAALTETPWPYSTTTQTPPQPSAPGLQGLPVRNLEDLPDYSMPSAAAERRLLENLLSAQGRTPLYVNLTRRDFDIPVVRAIVPGLVATAERDRFSRPDVRLFARYQALFR